mmetsp:Transcript_31161/g.55920  ORF Transcript_31161/g.55920 Transcript_31161/m.55920 type:complete len:218 (+) Transcript_31161:467-1120(+)
MGTTSESLRGVACSGSAATGSSARTAAGAGAGAAASPSSSEGKDLRPATTIPWGLALGIPLPGRPAGASSSGAGTSSEVLLRDRALFSYSSCSVSALASSSSSSARPCSRGAPAGLQGGLSSISNELVYSGAAPMSPCGPRFGLPLPLSAPPASLSTESNVMLRHGTGLDGCGGSGALARLALRASTCFTRHCTSFSLRACWAACATSSSTSFDSFR